MLRWLRAGPWWRWLLPVAVLAAVGVAAYVTRGWMSLAFLGGFLAFAVLYDVIVHNPGRLGTRLPFVGSPPITAFVVAALIAPEQVGSSEFYKAAAAILPVLLLIFVVDKRSDFHSALPTERGAIVMMILYLVIASSQTLVVLAEDDPQLGSANLVTASLVAALTALGQSLLTSPRAESSEPESAAATPGPRPTPRPVRPRLPQTPNSLRRRVAGRR
jgi:hypothetical protein